MPKENIFDKVAYYYDNTISPHIVKHYLNKRIKFITKFIRNGSSVLDVGCGTGVFVIALSELNIKSTISGCDSSFEMLKIGKNQKKNKFTCCDSSQLSYKNESFDIIISIALFHHLKNESTIFNTVKEMMRVAKRNSKIIIWDTNNLNPYWSFLFKRMPQDKEVEKALPLRKITDIIKKEGSISDIKIYRSGWIPDFAPKSLLSFFKFFEYIMERLPIIKLFSAHNVIVFTK